MISSGRAKRKCLGPFLFILCLSVYLLFTPQTTLAWSGITIGSTSSESITFGLYKTAASSGSIHWSGPGNSGMLIDSGFNGAGGGANVPALGRSCQPHREPPEFLADRPQHH